VTVQKRSSRVPSGWLSRVYPFAEFVAFVVELWMGWGSVSTVMSGLGFGLCVVGPSVAAVFVAF